MRPHPLVAALILSLSACATTDTARHSTPPKDAPPSARGALSDVAQVSAWLTGRFDNHLQVLDNAANEVAHPHERIHSIFRAVHNPALGEHLRYVEQYRDGDPTRVYRKRLYRFTAGAEGSVRLEMASFVDEAITDQAATDTTALQALTDAGLSWKRGCEVTWRRVDGHYEGQTSRGACVITARDGQTLTIEDDLYLDATTLRIQDRATNAAGERVFGHPEGVPHTLTRAAEFKGWAVMRDPKAEGGWVRAQALHMHDQGDEVALIALDGTPMPYSLRLAQRVYTATKTAILKFTVREPGAEGFIAYTWTEPDGERVGINLGDFQAGLTRIPPVAPSATTPSP